MSEMTEKSKNPPNFERSYRVIEYLMRNSDKDHTFTQEKLREKNSISEYLGKKQAFNRMINNIAIAMNSDHNELIKDQSEWRIFTDAFVKAYGNEHTDDDSGDDDSDDEEIVMRIKGLYYNHIFSYEEIDSLIEAIYFSKTLDTKGAKHLVEKIEQNLTTKFYKSGPRSICKVQEPELADKTLLRKNLLTIQQAIDSHVQISFKFNRYTKSKALEPTSPNKYTLSPYYIVASGGQYYLLACMVGKKNMSIWRIDLMCGIEIPESNGVAIKATRKNDVKNLPQRWSEDFQLSHLYMSFDDPVNIRLKVTCDTYTFLHDYFGKTFKYIRTDEDGGDIVDVKCSPFAMVHWALQYSDRVEVLEPQDLRNTIIEKINNLSKKYSDIEAFEV